MITTTQSVKKLKSCLKIKNWFPPPYYFFENLKVLRGNSGHLNIFLLHHQKQAQILKEKKIRPFAPPRMIAKIYIINLSECDCCHILKK